MAKPSRSVSPIKAKPLPTPGLSLRTRAWEQLDDKITGWAGAAAVMLGCTAWQWYAWLFNQPPRPVFFTIGSAFVLVLLAWKIRSIRHEAHALKQGYEGEAAVGQYLERLRVAGYQVFHDVPGDSKQAWNIDHVLIGPGGIFAVETKTISKRSDRHNVIGYDGEQVRINGLAPDRDPVAQARASADRIREILLETTGRELQVRPVLVYPNWFIKGKSAGKQVWVLEPKALPKWLSHEPAKLAPEDVALYSARLSAYVREVLDR